MGPTVQVRKGTRLGVTRKAFSLGISSCRAVIACSDRNILIYDLNLSKPEQVRQSSLQQQIRVSLLLPFEEVDAYAIGTVDGRVAIEYFDPKSMRRKSLHSNATG